MAPRLGPSISLSRWCAPQLHDPLFSTSQIFSIVDPRNTSIPSGMVISLKNERLFSQISVAVGDGVSVGGGSDAVGLGRGGARGVSGTSVSEWVNSLENSFVETGIVPVSSCVLVLFEVQATMKMLNNIIKMLAFCIPFVSITSVLRFVIFKLKGQI